MKKILFLLMAISFVLAGVWFLNRHIIASGESGIIFYNPLAAVNILRHTWGEAILGNVAGIVLVTLPFYAFIALLASLRVPGFFIQYLVFASLLLLQSIFSVFLLKNLMQIKDNRLLLAGAVFYVFNLIAVVSVWNRVQYPFIFFYSFLPLVVYVFLKGIQRRSFFYMIVLNIIFLLFGIVFASIPFIELTWFILFLFVFYFTITNFNDKNFVKFMWIYLIANILVWLLWNSWWIFQFIDVTVNTKYLTTSAYGISSDLGTFIGLSKRLGNLSYVFRLMNQDFFISMSSLWHGVYDFPLMIILTYLIPALAFFPLLLKKKSKEIYFFLGSSLLFVFLIKGSSDPFGGVALFLFSHIRLLEAFRNPFEKIGLVLPLLYMPLIVFTLSFLINYFKRKRKVNILFWVIVATCIIISFPLLNGLVFTSTISPSNNLLQGDQVEVPSYYDAASRWLLSQTDDLRIVALPIGTEGITYNWPYGYSGVELTNNLLGVPAVSLDTNIQFLSPIAQQLQYTLIRHPQDFSKLMTILNSKYLLVRNDINFAYRDMADPKVIKTNLEKNIQNKTVNLQKDKTFGALSFYKNQQVSPKIYAVNHFSIASPDISYSDIFSLLNTSGKDIAVSPMTPDINAQTLPYASGEILSPNTTINFSEFPTVKLKDAYAQLPYISILPNSYKYSLLMLKERMDQFFLNNDRSKYLFHLQSLNKRLAELVTILSMKNMTLVDKAVKSYISEKNNFSNFLNTSGGQTESQNDLYNFRYSMLSQMEILDDLCSSSKNREICYGSIDFKQFAQRFGFDSLYKYKLNLEDQNQRTAYRFNITHSGKYEVVLKREDLEKFYGNIDLLNTFQIDNHIENKPVQDDENYLSFGTYLFKSGVHEIQLSIPSAKNLSTLQDNNLIINSHDTKPGMSVIPINPFDQFGKYKISFDYWFEKGSVATVSARNELSLPVGRTYVSTKINNLQADAFIHTYQHSYNIYVPNPNSIANELEIQAFPYNDCIQQNKDDFLLKMQCNWDNTFKNLFNKETTLSIKDISVQREFTNPLFLISQNTIKKTLTTPQITFIKKSPVEYSILVKNAKTPFFLVFLEAFHPLWKASTTINGRTVIFQNHFIANNYANSWYITQRGTYTITLVFDAENYFSLGIVVSLLTFFGVMIGYLYKKYK